MSNGVNQCAACGDLWDDDEPHVACRSDHGHDPTDEAVALLKSIGLDITYTDEGLRVVARRIMSIGGEDEQNRQYAAQSKNWTAGYEQGVSDERERAAERVAALPHEDACCSNGCACQRWDKQEPCDLSCNCSFWWLDYAVAAARGGDA